MRRGLSLAGFLVVVGSVPCNAASNIAVHAHARNPVTEGWILNDESSGAHQFHAVRKAGIRGPGAWRVDTETNGGVGVGAYQRVFPFELPSAWELDVTLRTVDIEALGGQEIHLGTGIPLPGGESLHYSMRFGVSDDGDPLVALGPSGVPFEVNGGADGFHRYRFYVDLGPRPTSSFSVDGVRIGSVDGYSDPSSVRVLEWGDLNSDPAVNGIADWDLIRFDSAIPEPTSLALILAAGVILPVRRFRKN
jgi:hypothetical protein